MASVNTPEGTIIGRLTLKRKEVRYIESRKRNISFAVCVCECGKETTLTFSSLGTDTFSCGCLGKENRVISGKFNKTHGMSGTPTYKCWAGMWERCTNEKNEKYPLYKDRTPPERWKSFELFLEDMGEGGPGLSIERIDNDKPYGPGNCKWIPLADQGKNTSRVRWVVKGEVEVNFGNACDLEGKDRRTVSTRLNQLGWSLEEALGPGWKWKEDGVRTLPRKQRVSTPRLEAVREVDVPPDL